MKRTGISARSEGPLSLDEIAQLSSTGDHQFVPARTPGLTRMSAPERAILWGILILLALLYIHLEIWSFLPLRWDAPLWMRTVGFAALVLVLLYIALLLILQTVAGITWIRYRLLPPRLKTACADCGTWSEVKRYAQGSGCRKCGSRRVYCGKCEKPSAVEHFGSRLNGCPHCGFSGLSVQY